MSRLADAVVNLDEELSDAKTALANGHNPVEALRCLIEAGQAVVESWDTC